MYAVRHINVAAPGKGPQLRAALEEHSKAINDAGGSAGVSQRMFAPGPQVFVNTIDYESLAAREAYAEAMATDEAWRARTAKTNENRVGPPFLELREYLVRAHITGNFKYALRIIRPSGRGQGD